MQLPRVQGTQIKLTAQARYFGICLLLQIAILEKQIRTLRLVGFYS